MKRWGGRKAPGPWALCCCPPLYPPCSSARGWLGPSAAPWGPSVPTAPPGSQKVTTDSFGMRRADGALCLSLGSVTASPRLNGDKHSQFQAVTEPGGQPGPRGAGLALRPPPALPVPGHCCPGPGGKVSITARGSWGHQPSGEPKLPSRTTCPLREPSSRECRAEHPGCPSAITCL